MCVLPVSNGELNFKSTVLRAPKELDDIIADLSFSARVYFFLIFLFENICGARRKIMLLFWMFELRRETFENFENPLQNFQEKHRMRKNTLGKI